MGITIQSTTDTADEVQAAMGGLKPSHESKVEEKESSESEETTSDETAEESEASEKDESQDADEVEDKGEEEKDELPKKKSGFQKRIEKLNKRVADRDQEIEYWKKQALKAAKSGDHVEAGKAEQMAASAEHGGKPHQDAFETHEEYVEALTEWKLEKKLAERDEKEAKDKAKQSFNSRLESHQQKVVEFVKDHPDFHELVEDFAGVQLSVVIEESILDSGPELMYHLMKDREEFERINALPPVQAAREIGKFEARLASKKEQPKQEIKKPKAPQPLNPVSARSSGVAKDPEKMTYQEFKKWRESEP